MRSTIETRVDGRLKYVISPFFFVVNFNLSDPIGRPPFDKSLNELYLRKLWYLKLKKLVFIINYGENIYVMLCYCKAIPNEM